jgi:hypothetical protein
MDLDYVSFVEYLHESGYLTNLNDPRVNNFLRRMDEDRIFINARRRLFPRNVANLLATVTPNPIRAAAIARVNNPLFGTPRPFRFGEQPVQNATAPTTPIVSATAIQNTEVSAATAAIFGPAATAAIFGPPTGATRT